MARTATIIRADHPEQRHVLLADPHNIRLGVLSLGGITSNIAWWRSALALAISMSLQPFCWRIDLAGDRLAAGLTEGNNLPRPQGTQVPDLDSIWRCCMRCGSNSSPPAGAVRYLRAAGAQRYPAGKTARNAEGIVQYFSGKSRRQLRAVLLITVPGAGNIRCGTICLLANQGDR